MTPSTTARTCGAGLSLVLAACGSNRAGPGQPAFDGGAPTDSGTRAEAALSDAGSGDAVGAPTGLWSTGYYASYNPSQYPVADIEWAGLTHVAIAFYTPNPDGSLTLLGANPGVVGAVIAAAHAHGVKAVASIGGSNSGPGFEQATLGGTRSAFVQNLSTLVTMSSYDGIDIDWEPLNASDVPIAVDLANQLRAASPGLTMTIAIGYVNPNAPPDLSGYPGIAAAYDQLNIESYGMAGAWPGWKSWHNSPLYQQDPSTPLSIDSTVSAYAAAGVPKAKLGVGIGFFGLCYSPPVTGPVQTLGASTIVASDGKASYANIMGEYYAASARMWDSVARVPYLSFGSAHPPDGCTYISYDDEQSIAEKGAYVKAQGLGGVMQWEINEAYLSAAPAGQGSTLLDAIRDHVLH